MGCAGGGAVIERVADFMTGLHAARDLEGSFAALRRLGAAHGFEEMVLGRFRANGSRGALAPAEFAATHPDGVRRYIKAIADDPVMNNTRPLEQPLVYTFEQASRLARTTAERRFLEDPHIRRSWLRIAFPMTATPDGGWWMVVMGGTDLVTEPGEAAASLPVLWLAASAAATRAEALSATGRPEGRLTARERECLLWLAKGDRVDRIAGRLGLSDATVEFHLANARRRLDARTSTEATATAILMGLIAP